MALAVGILNRARSDLDTALMHTVRLQLKAILMVVMVMSRLLLVGGQDCALIASMARILHLGYTLLVVDQDTVDSPFAAALILGETAHLVLDLPLATTSVLSCRVERPGRRSLLLVSVAVLEGAVLRGGQHYGLGVLGGGRRRRVEIENTLESILLTAIVLISELGPSSAGRESLNGAFFALSKVLLDRHVAHQSTLRCLDLVEELALVADLDWQNLWCLP